MDTDVLVNITSGKVRLLFEMPFSQRTNAFVSEILRAAEGNIFEESYSTNIGLGLYIDNCNILK